MKNGRLSALLRICGMFLALAISVAAQVPAPKDVLGWTPGDDRKLASWAQVVDYFKKLDAASDRVMFQEIGKTTMGAPFVYATISSPENLRNLEKYKKINDLLADPRKMRDGLPLEVTPVKNNNQKRRVSLPGDISERLIREGKTIVMITCGVHSNEVGSYLSSMLIAHRLASSNDADVKKILDNTIVLLVPSLNPDGVDIINNWYQKTLGTKFEGTEPPELYHKYVGHDDNRDWYAFTQVETQLTVDKIHNVWHPQIVHDIHQQGQFGSRLFLPPYMQPVEPNVPKQIVEGYTELGNYMAADLRKQGFQGITTNSTYDAWTPARADSHYHGGVRILSETASAKLATPVTIKWEDIRGGEGYDSRTESPTFGPVWKGGEWHLSDITRYMTTAAFSLLNNAANEREKWLSRFYEIGKEAVRQRKEGEVASFLLPRSGSFSTINERFVDDILDRAGVETHVTKGFVYNGRPYRSQSRVVYMDQPYGAFAKALFEEQHYPDLKDDKGNPTPPYDVTAHTIPLLTDTRAVPVLENTRFPILRTSMVEATTDVGCLAKTYEVQVYRSSVPSIDEGWTRWSLNNSRSSRHPFIYPCDQLTYSSLTNSQIGKNEIKALTWSLNVSVPGTIIFPDQSPNQILNGYAKGTMPDEYTGGVGKDGVENLKKFVEAGGTLVFLNRASNFAIEQFDLPIRDVTKGLVRKDFYIPGSILRTELDTNHPIAKRMPAESIAWFESGPAFEIYAGWASTSMAPPTPWQLIKKSDIRIIAQYPSDPSKILLSGWALGAEKIAGKAALVEVTVGKGKIILFGFRPQYRGQSLATFPLLFNAISR